MKRPQLGVLILGTVLFIALTMLPVYASSQHEPVTDSVRVSVHVISQEDIDVKCGLQSRGCTIDNKLIYIPGDVQYFGMWLSPEFVNALPEDDKSVGYILAEKFGLELDLDASETLGHEFLNSVAR